MEANKNYAHRISMAIENSCQHVNSWLNNTVMHQLVTAHLLVVVLSVISV
jgi:hypothetical protein